MNYGTLRQADALVLMLVVDEAFNIVALEENVFATVVQNSKVVTDNLYLSVFFGPAALTSARNGLQFEPTSIL